MKNKPINRNKVQFFAKLSVITFFLCLCTLGLAVTLMFVQWNWKGSLLSFGAAAILLVVSYYSDKYAEILEGLH